MRVTKDGKLISSIDDWHLHAPPKRPTHWTPERSAYELARAWCPPGGVAGLPQAIRQVLDSRTETANLTIDVAYPEHPILFDEYGGEPRNADIAFVGHTPTGRVAVTVEAKADEPFGETVAGALARALERALARPRSKGLDRMKGLSSALFVPWVQGQPKLCGLRYQLLTAVAGTLAFAAAEAATTAVFVVHEFVTDRTSESNRSRNAADLSAFIARLTGRQITVGDYLSGPFHVPGSAHVPSTIPLFVTKVVTDLRSSRA